MKRIRPAKLTLAFAALLALPLLLVSTPRIAADTVFKTDGGKLRGVILEENAKGIKIRAYGAIYEIPRDEILRIERDGDVSSEYQQRAKKLKDWDEKGWLKLGEWCQDNDLTPDAIDCFYKVIQINPDNATARFELGHRKLRGKWVPEREYYESKGYVRYRDSWVTKADYDKYEMGLVKVGEEWISAEELERREQEALAAKPRAGSSENGERRAKPASPSGEATPKAGRLQPPAPRRRNPFAGPRAPRQDIPETPEERAAFVASEKSKGNWKLAHTSKFYNFFSNGPEDEAKQYARVMDKACVTFKKIFAYEKDIVRSFPIYMYANQPEFAQRTGRGGGVGGYYTSNGQIFSFHSKRAQSTLFHEGTHQFQGLALGSNMWRAKIWFIEGLAVYFEGSKERRNDLDTSPIPRDRLAHVKRAISSRSHVPIKTLIRMEQREFGALHYAHAWSLIYFFVNGTKGGKKRFHQYFNGVKEGREGVALFEECFDKPIEVIEKAWIDYVKHLRP